VRDIIYTSPVSKSEFVASNIKWGLSFAHAANRFTILQGDGDYYQDQGINSMAGELYFIFTPESEEEAAFFDVIKERGAATVTQPDKAETLNIQPLSISKSLDLVNDVTRVRYTVTFVTSRLPGEITSTRALFTSIQSKGTASVEAAGTVLEAQQDVNTLTAASRQVSRFSDALNDATRILNVAASDLEASIEDVVDNPVRAVIAFNQLIEQPGIIYNRLADKVKGYQDLIVALLNIETYPGQTAIQKANDLLLAEALVAAVIAAKTTAAIESGYDTKQQVLGIASQLVTDYAYSRDTLDSYQSSGFFQQTGTTQESTSVLVNSTAAFLYSISFDLKTEYVYTTEGPTTIYDIMAEYYTKKVEEEGEIRTLDYIVGTNNITGGELIEIPHGREVLVYV
jgi:hypothetical protein